MKTKKILIFAAFFLFFHLVAALRPVTCASIYHNLLQKPEGREKLAALARMEEERDISGIEALIEDSDFLIRLRCAEVLGRVNSPRGTAKLLERLAGDSSSEVAEAALFYLGLTGSEKASGVLEDCLKSCPRKLKIRAIEAMGRINPEKGAGKLAPSLKNFHSSIRAAAARAMFGLDPSEARSFLLDALFDPDPKVIAGAIYSMGRLECEKVDGRIIPFVFHDDYTVRFNAAGALGRLKSGEAVSAVSTLIRSRDRYMKIKAAEALSRIGRRDCASHLAPLLDSSDTYLRTLALNGLASSGNKDYYDRAAGSLSDSSGMVRVAAIGAVGSIDPGAARGRLRSILKKGSLQERKEAAEKLAGTGDEQDLALLTGLLLAGGDIFSREGAARGLGLWKDKDELRKPVTTEGESMTPLAALLETADGSDPVLAAIAAESAGKAQSKKVIERLLEIFAAHDKRMDCERKLAIVRAAGNLFQKLDDDRYSSAMTDLLKAAAAEPDPRIREESMKIAGRLEVDLSGAAVPASEWKRGDQPWGGPVLPFGTRRLLLSTQRGEIEIELFGDEAPNIVASVIYLVKNGFYDGLAFHRVVPGFVIQGGCPRGDGWGDAGYFLRSQFNTRPYERGAVGMAHAGKDTPGSQFFITQTRQYHLDGRYTVIGQVLKGMEVVDIIERGDTFTASIIE